jgi:hypothetical protein
MKTSIIPDGNHSDFTSIILAHRALGERLFMVTDGILALGTDLKTFMHSNQAPSRLKENFQSCGPYIFSKSILLENKMQLSNYPNSINQG